MCMCDTITRVIYCDTQRDYREVKTMFLSLRRTILSVRVLNFGKCKFLHIGHENFQTGNQSLVRYHKDQY